MTEAQQVALLDAAMSRTDPAGYLGSVAQTFGYVGRDADARLAHRMSALIRADQDAVLTRWRADWAATAR